jgi:hypothetical protein
MDDRFRHHPPRGEETIAKHQAARTGADDFFNLIEQLAPNGREKALAITKVEEAMFWLNAAIARNQ